MSHSARRPSFIRENPFGGLGALRLIAWGAARRCFLPRRAHRQCPPSLFFLLHRRHPLLLPTLSPQAIAGILDTATTPALSLLSSLAVNPVVFSLNATASPLSLLCFFSTNPSALASMVTVPPFPISSPTTQEGLCSLTTMAATSRPSSFSSYLSVFLPAPPPPSSLPSLPPDLAVGPGSSPSSRRRRPLLPSSPTITPPLLTPLSSASSPPPLPAFSSPSSFAERRRPPVSSLPHLLSFFSSAPPLTSPSTLATAVAAAVRPHLFSFSSFLYSAADTTADCRLYCRRRSHPSPPPSLFFSCHHCLHPSS